VARRAQVKRKTAGVHGDFYFAAVAGRGWSEGCAPRGRIPMKSCAAMARARDEIAMFGNTTIIVW